MCLLKVYTDEDMNRIVEELPEVAPGVVEVWKAAETKEGAFCAIIALRDYIYQNGINIATQVKIYESYWSGYHFYSKRSACWGWAKNAKFLRCYIKKEWITAVGTLGGQTYPEIAFVTSQAFSPLIPKPRQNWKISSLG